MDTAITYKHITIIAITIIILTGLGYVGWYGYRNIYQIIYSEGKIEGEAEMINKCTVGFGTYITACSAPKLPVCEDVPHVVSWPEGIFQLDDSGLVTCTNIK